MTRWVTRHKYKICGEYPTFKRWGSRQDGWDCSPVGGLDVDCKEEGGRWPPDGVEDGCDVCAYILSGQYRYVWCGKSFVLCVWKMMSSDAKQWWHVTVGKTAWRGARDTFKIIAHAQLCIVLYTVRHSSYRKGWVVVDFISWSGLWIRIHFLRVRIRIQLNKFFLK